MESEKYSAPVSIVSFLLISIIASYSSAIDVIPGGSEKTGECRIAFKGEAFPYVVRLFEVIDDKRIVTWRGLGLRGPWYEGVRYYYSAWHQNGFMDIKINNKSIFQEKAYRENNKFVDSWEVFESGKRALAEYMFERDTATVRLRFLMRAGCRVLFAEVKIEPKTTIDDFSVSVVSYPGAYTKGMSPRDGDRRVKTALREIKQGERVEKLDLDRENWLLIYDELLDPAKPFPGGVNNGNAGFYILSEGIETFGVHPTDYPVSAWVKAKPGVTRLRMAFNELHMSNAESLKVMRETAEEAQKILKEDTFCPALVDNSNAETDKKQIKGILKRIKGREKVKLAREVSGDLSEVQKVIEKFRETGTANTIKDERAVLESIYQYQRNFLTIDRWADESINLLQMRGPGYGYYRLNEAEKFTGKKTEIRGGYFKSSVLGKTISFFPNTVGDLYRYDAVFVMDIDVAVLTPQQLNLLKQYVEDGGTLIIFGGFYSYGASNIKDTVLAEILPFKIEVFPMGLRRTDGKLRLVKSGILKNVKWPDNLTAPWYHELAPGAGAEVIINNGGRPWMVMRNFGKGKVVACAGTVFGEAKEGGKMFYKWELWPQFMANLMKWLIDK
ncbi:MAG: glutamine amidotransferase [Kiritimatiellae bacterium]|nr:glutamine amidotransferase [Kiritimatiellia bacterium]